MLRSEQKRILQFHNNFYIAHLVVVSCLFTAYCTNQFLAIYVKCKNVKIKILHMNQIKGIRTFNLNLSKRLGKTFTL